VLYLADLIEALGGVRPTGEPVGLSALCVDSREASPGAFFVALPGEQADGHDFVARAVQAGALGALVSRPVAGLSVVELDCRRPERITLPVQIVVPDTLLALQQIARWLRAQRPDVSVVGVTGSVGKTTAKEAIASVLGCGAATLKSAGNRNNEIGLPLTLCQLDPAHRYAVLEMGMYALGEIALLCGIARPNVGVVTNVGPTHLERLGSLERIVQAKAELVQALPPDGLAVLNGSDARVADMARFSAAPVLTFGLGQAGDYAVTATAVRATGLGGSDVTVAVRGDGALGLRPARQMVHTAMLGQHAVWPALAAVSVGLAAGLDWPALRQGLASLGGGPRLVPLVGRNGTTLLDDSYNASPVSAHAALDALAQLSGRHVAVLGDMLELGDAEALGHREVGDHCARVVDLLLTVGPRARGIAQGARAAGMSADRVMMLDTKEQALAELEALLAPGDLILIKGSRGMALEALVAALRQPKSENG
jgi:UDP-N-acetylmuramoyl-tripeptide--D-alanyl-D-alanine ligase